MNVGIVKTWAHYPRPPFHPSAAYPEYPYSRDALSQEANPVYDAVRKALYLAGLDRERFGTSSWNPFRQFVGEGSRIVLKPNFVNHYNLLRDEPPFFEALVTHASVLRPLIDYVLLAANGDFTLTLSDLPVQTADFDALVAKTGLEDVLAFVGDRTSGRGVIELVDLRDYQLMVDQSGAILGRRKQPGDPLGYAAVDLGSDSRLVPLEKDAHRFRVLDYEKDITVQRHTQGLHQYILSRTILKSDFLINVPKLKVHRKTGVTLSLKNLVGAIGDKSCLPHYREGGPESGGDECPVSSRINAWRGRYSFALRQRGRTTWRLLRPLGRALLHLNGLIHGEHRLINVTGGDWYGNDTIWRMVHDINSAVFHADDRGVLHDDVKRKHLTVVDGIIGGEGEGPLSPDPVSSGLIAAGADPVAVDICCIRLMGLDWRRMPLYSRCDAKQRYGFSPFDGELERIGVTLMEGDRVVTIRPDQLEPVHRFKPAPGWRGHIEL